MPFRSCDGLLKAALWCQIWLFCAEFDEEGIPLDGVHIAPDWVIEILSPDQSSNRVTANIAHCLNFGCQMGWLIDPKDRSILMMMPDRAPELYQEDNLLVFLEKLT